MVNGQLNLTWLLQMELIKLLPKWELAMNMSSKMDLLLVKLLPLPSIMQALDFKLIMKIWLVLKGQSLELVTI